MPYNLYSSKRSTSLFSAVPTFPRCDRSLNVLQIIVFRLLIAVRRLRAAHMPCWTRKRSFVTRTQLAPATSCGSGVVATPLPLAPSPVSYLAIPLLLLKPHFKELYARTSCCRCQ